MGFFIQNKYAIAFKKSKDKILILGASGFLGNALYKELYRYYNTYGTYHSGRVYSDNKHYLKFDLVNDDVYELLRQVQPSVIISALRGPFSDQLEAHELMVSYAQETGCRIIFLSSANVFDAFSNYPSYENDKTLSQSIYGKLKIRVETLLMRHLPEEQYAIVRLPMVFGNQSPRVLEILQHIKDKTPIEVFPNLIMNVTTDTKITQQIHYIINRNKSGVFHLGSSDLVHHDDFIKEIIKSLGDYKALLKQVYTTNDDRYLAVLPKYNLLPKNLHLQSQDILNELKI